MAVGTDMLFENHTIKEIQEIEKKLRNDIERKKEELRQMVGERYRDLMEAADTITEMKDIAASVTNCVKSIESGCIQLQQSSLNSGILNRIQEKVTERRKQSSLLYTVAALIKILVDSPEKIWSSIENKDFLNAVSLFLLARHTHTLLILDPLYQEHKISQKFPIIIRQWTSINHLKYVLIQNCELMLETQNIEPQNVLGPLCCHCLLSNSSLEAILLKVLNTRKDVIKSIFKPEKYAKDQICEFVTVIQTTLQILYVLLYYEDENVYSVSDRKTNLLYHTLKNITSKDEKGPVTLLDMNSSEAFKFIPEVITDFRPLMNQPIVPCSLQMLQSKCSEWLDDVKRSFSSELVNLLSFVKSVKSIALIRQAVVTILSEPKYWDEVSNKLLNKSFSVWDFFLKECFSQRIKDIIYDHIRCASSDCQKSVEEVLSQMSNNKNLYLEFEQNVASYVWIEGSCDVVDNVAWISRHQRNLWNSGELSMKVMGFTPKIQSICKDLDQQMKDAVEDVCTFSCLENPVEGTWMKDMYRQQQTLVSADASHIFIFLMEAVERYISELSLFIENTLSCLKCEKEDFRNSSRIVFLGHLSHGITNLCLHINTCLSSEKLIENVESYKGQGTKFSISVIKECDLWKHMKKKFLDICSMAFQIWSESHISQLLKTMDAEMKIGSAEGLLKSLLHWEKVEIQEESEQGNAVKSVLKIPQYVSVFLSDALFTFCCKLNEVGGYVIHSDIRSHISKELLSGLLNLYKKKIDSVIISGEFSSRLLQVQSLQLLFDVQFLMGLMVHKDKSSDQITQLSQEIINKAVSHVDPFDMDVFSTPLQQNLKKALQKSLSLYGLLASTDQVTYLNSIKTQVIHSQMEHNIMLSSISSSRFPLLPLSSRTNISNEVDYISAPKETEIKPLQSHRSSPNLNAADIPTNPMKTASFYDRVTAMSSSWFGN